MSCACNRTSRTRITRSLRQEPFLQPSCNDTTNPDCLNGQLISTYWRPNCGNTQFLVNNFEACGAAFTAPTAPTVTTTTTVSTVPSTVFRKTNRSRR